MAKFIENLSTKAERIGKRFTKDMNWAWYTEQQNVFETLKQDMIQIATLKPYDSIAETVLTTDASTTG